MQKADPAARRRVALFIAVAALLGSALTLGLDRYRGLLTDWLLQDPAETRHRLRIVLAAVAVAGSVPLLALSAYLYRIAGRVSASNRFPPPGMAVVRDTPVLTGQAAGRQARLLYGAALLFAAFALTLPIVLWRVVRQVGLG